MRTRLSQRAFPPGPFYIDVNPLMIACTVSELIDAPLVNGEPVGDSQFLSHELPKGADIVLLSTHVYPPSPCIAADGRLTPSLSTQWRGGGRSVFATMDWCRSALLHK